MRRKHLGGGKGLRRFQAVDRYVLVAQIWLHAAASPRSLQRDGGQQSGSLFRLSVVSVMRARPEGVLYQPGARADPSFIM